MREDKKVCRVDSTPEISFGPEDKGESRESHGDALLITSDIAGFNVAWIFMDTGSSMDTLFIACLWRMNLNVKLEPIETALYRFIRGAIHPIGQMILKLA